MSVKNILNFQYKSELNFYFSLDGTQEGLVKYLIFKKYADCVFELLNFKCQF